VDFGPEDSAVDAQIVRQLVSGPLQYYAGEEGHGRGEYEHAEYRQGGRALLGALALSAYFT